MNYRHDYHAGNFADVAKHLALVAALLHLRKKDKPFAVIDTHAGAGRTDLSGEAARRTGEAKTGIAKLRGLAGQTGLPDALATYLEIANADASVYPGSPLIAAKLLRAQDRLAAIEKHPEAFAGLRDVLAPFASARAVEGDGYARLPALLSPRERRGLVLIDPPYEDPREFRLAADALAGAYRRFTAGIYMLWFPVKSHAAAEAFCGEVLAGGIAKALRIDIAVRPSPRGGKDRLTEAGLIVVNPPYGFADEMRACAEIVVRRLGPGAWFSVTRLAGEGA